MPDRYGDEPDEDQDHGDTSTPEPQRPPHECHGGWLDYDAALPCLTCRPHLTPEARRAELGLPTPRPVGDHQAGSAAVRAAWHHPRTAKTPPNRNQGATGRPTPLRVHARGHAGGTP
ncbi:MAG: hypothetical protein ABIQ18_47710 [Umezawaea sp.]